jgi:hypothetical protein
LFYSRTKIRMISSVRKFSVRILDADRFTIVIFQILDIKSNYLPGIVQLVENPNGHKRCVRSRICGVVAGAVGENKYKVRFENDKEI